MWAFSSAGNKLFVVCYLNIGTFCHSVFSSYTVYMPTLHLYFMVLHCIVTKKKALRSSKKQQNIIIENSPHCHNIIDVDGWGFCCVFISFYVICRGCRAHICFIFMCIKGYGSGWTDTSDAMTMKKTVDHSK